MASVPFWIPNLSAQRRQWLEDRWNSELTQAQLQIPWQRVVLSLPAQTGQPPVWRVMLPGIATLRRLGRKVKAQVGKVSGGDGGPVTFRGLENPAFDIDVELYTPTHFAQWLSVLEKLDVVGDPRNRQSYVIEHPLATMSKVRQVIVVGQDHELPMGGGPLMAKLSVLGWDNRRQVMVVSFRELGPNGQRARRLSASTPALTPTRSDGRLEKAPGFCARAATMFSHTMREAVSNTGEKSASMS